MVGRENVHGTSGINNRDRQTDEMDNRTKEVSKERMKKKKKCSGISNTDRKVIQKETKKKNGTQINKNKKTKRKEK